MFPSRWTAVVLTLGLWVAGQAQALTIARLTPQGEVARVRQVVARFDAPAVQWGNAQAPAPLSISCNDAQASRGQGRWTSEREWVFDFAADLPPGVSCAVTVLAGFKSHTGQALTGVSRYQFNTGGPFVQSLRPYSGQTIEEEQFFILQLNGAATGESVQKHVWCKIDGVGERVPVRLIGGAERQALLAAEGLQQQEKTQPQRWQTLACNRRMSAGSSMELVFDAGVSTPSGIANKVQKRFDYQVREAFSAEFSCERENAQAACLPIRALRLQFNAPMARKQALAIRLKNAQQSLAPVIDGEEEGDADALVQGVRFNAPLPLRSQWQIELPANFQDAAERALANAASFPLKVAIGDYPPLAKFAAAPFGVVERFAEGPPADKPPALLPVTLRKVEADLQLSGLQAGAAPTERGQVSRLQPQSDAQIIAWQRKLERYDAALVQRQQARADGIGVLPKVLDPDMKDFAPTRMLSLLSGQKDVQKLSLPKAASQDPRPFEVVGIPLPVGFHVLEIASPLLGQALLDERYGGARTMYVRSSALVTNLAVHFKLGRENASAWVTTLDKGQPVAGAQVRVSNCQGQELAQGSTDARGLVQLPGLSPEPPRCQGGGDDDWRAAYFVSARAVNEGAPDMAFTWSDWQRGIEPWRFNLPQSSNPEPDQVAHTVFDRSLLRAGETLSMKHFVRQLTGSGFALPKEQLTHAVITHVGSGQEFKLPLQWRKTATGGRSSAQSWHVPQAAKLGVYTVELLAEDGRRLESGSFRVEEFRLPVFAGQIAPADKKPLVRVRAVPTQVQINYVAGGGAAQLPVRVSAMVQDKSLHYPDFDDFSFSAPRRRDAQARSEDPGDHENDSASGKLVADKLPVVLDKTGQAQVTIEALPPAARAQDLLLEASYADPNGELQTLSSRHSLWPAAVVAGIKTEGWASSASQVRWQALALGLDGKPLAGVPLSVQALARSTSSTRKRIVGGFYSYDNQAQTHDLGTVCSGKSDARGLLQCSATLKQPGEVELIVSARDPDGNEAQAADSIWLTRQGELWFGGQDHDRMDLLPEKKSYQPGETARFQVRMPFRYATALVSVEREGIIEQQVVELNGQDPSISLKVQPDWGPNVFVSVLALRGRLREVPWYSLFTWGYKAPREWWTAFWYQGKEYVAPTALVDLSKPAYRLGAAQIRVGSQAHQLRVQVKADKDSYPVRGQAQVTVQVSLPDGQPAAHAEVALAAVDQALLELMPNRSWQLLDAMLAQRSWGVQTATAQMEIVGRRHYGKKAVPAGGGGGHAPTRELLDTLLLWQPALQLDAQGQAKITVPLNDALTRFEIVAIADASIGLFGTGSTHIASKQDLQIISGLPPLVREGDAFSARISLRNTTAKDMRVQVQARASLLELPAQTVSIAAGAAADVLWPVTAPEQLGQTRAQALLWEVSAQDAHSGARDALKVSQRIIPAIPVTVQQGRLLQIDASASLAVASPPGALAGRGGVQIALQPRLAEGLPGVRDWWARYPYSCLEQQTSKAIGLGDVALWQSLSGQLPTYLDSDGLANYFPPRAGESQRGSDTLTAYLLAATHEASRSNPAFALPDEARAAMLGGLAAFVEGRIERKFWSPRKDLELRKLAAIEALARYGKAQPRMLDSISIAPNQWPTHAVIDWYNVLRNMENLPNRAQRMGEVLQILQSRISYQGSKLLLGTDAEEDWWWLMQSADVNSARLLLAVLDESAWKDDWGRIASGFIGRQQNGAWQTTTANFWGALALQRFSQKLEASPVSGTTVASLGKAQAALDWSQITRVSASDTQGAEHQRSSFGAPAAPGMLQNNRLLLPWGAQGGELSISHQGAGKPWASVQALAAVPLQQPLAAGFSLQKTVTAVEQADKTLPAGSYSRGDVLRVTLEVTSQADMTWVAITDPIPSGATILGSGLGRDSALATEGERSSGAGWPAYEERSFEAFRSYYEYLPKGRVMLQYTLRLNNEGSFQLPPSRVEALYAPEMFGATPNARVQVKGGR